MTVTKDQITKELRERFSGAVSEELERLVTLAKHVGGGDPKEDPAAYARTQEIIAAIKLRVEAQVVQSEIAMQSVAMSAVQGAARGMSMEQMRELARKADHEK